MNKKLILLFNHSLTNDQVADAKTCLGVGDIVNLPDRMKNLWADLPPDLAEIRNYLAPIKDWLDNAASVGDYILIQGDFGACYLMVRYSFENELVPVYSTTQRVARESVQKDGAVMITRNFKHVMFRKYGA
jgi:hypothetical protein